MNEKDFPGAAPGLTKTPAMWSAPAERSSDGALSAPDPATGAYSMMLTSDVKRSNSSRVHAHGKDFAQLSSRDLFCGVQRMF